MTRAEKRGYPLRVRWPAWMLCVLFLLTTSPAHASTWSRQYISHLPDSAFAVIETTPEGKKVRHLPHHDARGNLDVAHLCTALSRFNQVKWRDPSSAELARQHLRDHLAQHGGKPCRPIRKDAR